MLIGQKHTNGDWARSIDDRLYTSRYFTFVRGNFVTWKSKKHVVAHSSTKAEYQGIALGLWEALWLQHLLQDLGYSPKQPMQLFCEDKTTCDILHNLV